jgi:hypothetical protein
MFKESDVIELDNQLKLNSSLPTDLQRSVADIKKTVITDVVKQFYVRLPERSREFDRTGFPAVVCFLDLSALRPFDSDFPFNKPYLLVRQDYLVILDRLEQERDGSRGSVVITGQPGIGQSSRDNLKLMSDSFFPKLKREEPFPVLAPLQKVVGRSDNALPEGRSAVSFPT